MKTSLPNSNCLLAPGYPQEMVWSTGSYYEGDVPVTCHLCIRIANKSPSALHVNFSGNGLGRFWGANPSHTLKRGLYPLHGTHEATNFWSHLCCLLRMGAWACSLDGCSVGQYLVNDKTWMKGEHHTSVWVTRKTGEQLDPTCVVERLSWCLEYILWGLISGEKGKGPCLFWDKDWGTINKVSNSEHTVSVING